MGRVADVVNILLFGAACAAFALGIGMLNMPQSPRWLVMAGRDYEARAVLARLRSGDPDTIEHEIDEIKTEVAAKPGTWHDLHQFLGQTPLALALLAVAGLSFLLYALLN